MLPDFILKLKEELKKSLPGSQAQARMAPYRRLIYDYPDLDSLNPRIACVLILLFPKKNEFTTVFIKRAEYIGVHSGQISFPGGRFEERDGLRSNTALREAKEETGIDVSRVEIIGQLTELYIPPSNFLVSPFVGFLDSEPAYKPDPREVDKIIEVPIPELMTAMEKVSEKPIKTSQDIVISAPYIDINGHHIWGATAMILGELEEVLKRIF